MVTYVYDFIYRTFSNEGQINGCQELKSENGSRVGVRRWVLNE